MRNLAMAAVAATVVAMAGAPAWAATTLLEATANAGACGGSVGCFQTVDQTIASAQTTDVAAAVKNSTLADGSFADASAKASFGALHVFADAFRNTGVLGDAQSRASVEFIDFAAPGQILGNSFDFTFQLSGSHTPTTGVYGATALADILYRITDTTTNLSLASGTWVSSDSNPTVTLHQNVFVPTGHGLSLDVYLEADAYTINYAYGPGVVNSLYPVQSDYSHTLKVYAASATPGGSMSWLSGHNYAAVPEPGTWSLLLAGVGLCGLSLRRRRRIVPA